MIRQFTYRIEPEYDSFTIREYLSLKGYPNAVFVQLKKTPESVLLNGIWAYMRTKLSAGDELFIRLEESTSSAHILPVSMPLSICYEDEDILAVNKPAQMPVHPSLNHYDHTLANAVCGYYNDQEIPYTFRCVNRLDRDTTGLTLIAKHMLSSAILSTAAARREISREYIAIASGKTPESGTIDAPIGRVAGSTIERQIDFENGERAITHYRRLAYHDGLSLLSLHLETGRTHQIRAHLASTGHPLLGDYKYGSKKWNDRYKKEWKIEDQVLHAYQLTMPGMKKELENLSGKTFYAKVPEVFWKLIKETAWEHGTREALEVLH